MAAGITGRFLWYQLNTPDIDKPLAFYPQVIGWGVEVWQPEGSPPYPLWKRGDVPVGGVMAMPPDAAGAPAHWLVYIGADDVDATFAAAVKAGAKACVPPMDIPQVGRFAVLSDPWGATFAIYKPAQDPGPEADPELGDFSWNEISADELEASWAFYAALFGWDLMTDHEMGEGMGTYRIFGRNGRQLGGMYQRPPQMPVNAWGPYVRVEDVGKTLDKAKAAGGATVLPPMEVPGGDHIAMFTDPQGAMFAVHSKG